MDRQCIHFTPTSSKDFSRDGTARDQAVIGDVDALGLVIIAEDARDKGEAPYVAFQAGPLSCFCFDSTETSMDLVVRQTPPLSRNFEFETTEPFVLSTNLGVGTGHTRTLKWGMDHRDGYDFTWPVEAGTITGLGADDDSLQESLDTPMSKSLSRITLEKRFGHVAGPGGKHVQGASPSRNSSISSETRFPTISAGSGGRNVKGASAVGVGETPPGSSFSSERRFSATSAGASVRKAPAMKIDSFHGQLWPEPDTMEALSSQVPATWADGCSSDGRQSSRDGAAVATMSYTV